MSRSSVRDAERSASSTGIVLGSIVHDLALIRAFAGDPTAIDAVDVWPEGRFPPSVSIAGRLPSDGRVSINWHFLPDYPAYREQVRVIYEAATIRARVPVPVSPPPTHQAPADRAARWRQPHRRLELDRRGVRGGAARVPRVRDGRSATGRRASRGPGGHRDLAASRGRPGRAARPGDRRRGVGVTEPTIIHLVPHTHWDREWYEPFQTFRMRLVDLIDLLLERMDADPRLRFTLDGQAATVDDYLEVRPEAEPLIRRLIAERRLAIGPWQILMDEFLVSGETIVRNLELGWARAEDLGGAMRVGYLPDMFGHIAQMPQILQRAGIDRAVVWRGVPMEIDRDTFRWRAPDGSEVIAEYLVGGYGNGAYLFDVPDRFSSKLAGYRVANAGFYGERSLLAMYGTDHAVPSARLADLVDEVNAERRRHRGSAWRRWPTMPTGDLPGGDGAPDGAPDLRTGPASCALVRGPTC